MGAFPFVCSCDGVVGPVTVGQSTHLGPWIDEVAIQGDATRS